MVSGRGRVGQQNWGGCSQAREVVEFLPLNRGESGIALLWRKKNLNSEEREELGKASPFQGGTARGDKLFGSLAVVTLSGRGDGK